VCSGRVIFLSLRLFPCIFRKYFVTLSLFCCGFLIFFFLPCSRVTPHVFLFPSLMLSVLPPFHPLRSSHRTLSGPRTGDFLYFLSQLEVSFEAGCDPLPPSAGLDFLRRTVPPPHCSSPSVPPSGAAFSTLSLPVLRRPPMRSGPEVSYPAADPSTFSAARKIPSLLSMYISAISSLALS